MIRSRINTFGFWIPPVALLMVSGFSLLVLLADPNPNDIIPVAVLWSMFLVLLTPAILTAKIITLNPLDQTITITRFFTKQSSTYNYDDFDGYVDMAIIPARGFPYRVLYLVKDERFVQIISGRAYSNLDEIEEGLSDMEYLGEKESSLFTHLKILLGFKV